MKRAAPSSSKFHCNPEPSEFLNRNRSINHHHYRKNVKEWNELIRSDHFCHVSMSRDNNHNSSNKMQRPDPRHPAGIDASSAPSAISSSSTSALASHHQDNSRYNQPHHYRHVALSPPRDSILTAERILQEPPQAPPRPMNAELFHSTPAHISSKLALPCSLRRDGDGNGNDDDGVEEEDANEDFDGNNMMMDHDGEQHDININGDNSNSGNNNNHAHYIYFYQDRNRSMAAAAAPRLMPRRRRLFLENDDEGGQEQQDEGAAAAGITAAWMETTSSNNNNSNIQDHCGGDAQVTRAGEAGTATTTTSCARQHKQHLQQQPDMDNTQQQQQEQQQQRGPHFRPIRPGDDVDDEDDHDKHDDDDLEEDADLLTSNNSDRNSLDDDHDNEEGVEDDEDRLRMRCNDGNDCRPPQQATTTTTTTTSEPTDLNDPRWRPRDYQNESSERDQVAPVVEYKQHQQPIHLVTAASEAKLPSSSSNDVHRMVVSSTNTINPAYTTAEEALTLSAWYCQQQHQAHSRGSPMTTTTTTTTPSSL